MTTVDHTPNSSLPYYKVLQSTTPYGKVLHSVSPYCTVLYTQYFWTSPHNAHKKWHLNFTKECSCHENDSHDCSSSHMKGHLHCAEQVWLSNLTKYCACQENDIPNQRNLPKTAEAFTMCGRSKNDPSLIWDPPRNPGYLSRAWANLKMQPVAGRLPVQISQNIATATKRDTWSSPNNAPATKSDTWISPNCAAATKVTLELHQ